MAKKGGGFDGSLNQPDRFAGFGGHPSTKPADKSLGLGSGGNVQVGRGYGGAKATPAIKGGGKR